MIFKNRHEAGQKLAKKLEKYKGKKDAVVLGIPRGGVEMAFDLAKALKVPLDVVVTKKIGHPYQSEFAIGAVSPGNFIVNEEYEKEVGKEYIKKKVRELNTEINRRYKEYSKARMLDLKNKIVIIADDGLATGYTMLAAIKYVKSQKPERIVVAIPVSARDSLEKVKKLVDEAVCLHIPIFFGAVGAFYEEFSQLDDKDVKIYLGEAKKLFDK